MENNSSKLFKQRLQRVHVSVGISASLFMYIAIFFGIFAMFLPYIEVWEKPSRHFETANIKNIDYSKMVDPVISNPEFPRNNIIIELPGKSNDPALHVRHQFVEAVVFNPKTMEKIQDEKNTSELGWFLNTMHYGRPFGLAGKLVFGFVAVAVMFLIIGGIYQILVLKYKSNVKNQQGKFSSYHRKILTWLFVPLLIVTLTGALMNLGYKTAGPMTYLVSNGETTNVSKLTRPILSPKREHLEKKNDTVAMLPINELIQKAQAVNPNVNFDRIKLINWKDSGAEFEIQGYNPKMPFLNGVYNDPRVVLSGVDGRLLHNFTVLDAHWSEMFLDSFYFLHLLFGVDIFIRIIMAIIMALCAGAIGFGVMLWLEKQAKKFEGHVPFYHWFSKLSLAMMVGVIPATAFLFLLQWVLPFDIEDRLVTQKGLFFLFWLATLTWAFYRINTYKAAKEFLFLGGFIFILSTIVHFYSSGFSPFELYENNIHQILLVDVSLFVLGVLLIYTSFKIPKDRDEAKLFFTKNTKGQQ